jgi:cbb3-type cytochrome oxidase cytochrome c subunit
MVGTQSSMRVIHAAPGSLAREEFEEEVAEQEKADIPPTTAELREMVAVAAYFRSLGRGFEPGHELEDWLAAENEIKELYGA